MGASNSANTNIGYYRLKAKTSESDPTPVIGKQVKTAEGYVFGETFNSFDGHLREIKWEEYDTDEGKKTKCKMSFKDKDGTANFLESNFNNLLYSILNAMASAKKIDFIRIEIWLGKSKEGSDKRYPNAKVENNGEKISWLYDYEHTPKPEKVTVGNKKFTDDSNVIEFWKNVIGDIRGLLAESPLAQQDPQSTTPPNTTTESKAQYNSKHEDAEAAGYSANTTGGSEDGSDLPF